MIGPLGSVPFQLTPGETAQVMVVIQNKNIGHSLVPEVRDLYEAWWNSRLKMRRARDLSQRVFEAGRMLDERRIVSPTAPSTTTATSWTTTRCGPFTQWPMIIPFNPGAPR